MSLDRLRIVLCTSGGAFGWTVLHTLRRTGRVEVVGIIESSRVLRPDYSWLEGAVAQIRLSGIRYALYLWTSTTLAGLLIRLRCSGKPCALPTHTTRTVNDAATEEFLRTLKPDLLVSAFFNQRIGNVIRDLPHHGAINIHPSLLPEFRGVDPVFFSMLRAHDQFGVTVHRMDDTLDTGHILAQERLDPAPDATLFCRTAQLYRTGAELLIARLDMITADGAGCPQTSVGNYDTWPKSHDLSEFHQRGHRLIRVGDLVDLVLGHL